MEVPLASFIHCTPDAEQLIVKMARVSNPANEDNTETAPRLLRYLIDHQHWSPFEMASLCIKINTERDIAAQIIRHRSFSFQEFSTRYANATVAETPNLRRQDLTNRQNSIDDILYENLEILNVAAATAITNSYLAYQSLIDAGVAKECARRVLPLCTPTVIYMHGTLRSWIHYILVRRSKETQLEHRLIACECEIIFRKHFPVIASACFNE